jgi:ABC-type multidrug transport system permease subunit
VIGLMAGNETVDEASGVRVMQFATPMAAVMGLLFAAFPPVAHSLALAREQRIAKRLRGTPLPTWAYLVGRVGGAVILSVASVVAMLSVGVVAYEFQVQWRSALAALVTLGTGVACLAALGLAVGALARSASMAQTAAIASALVVAFLSGLMTFGLTPPAWMDTLAAAFPLRYLLDALGDQVNPFLSGPGWDLAALAVPATWGAGAIALAAWALQREPGATSARAGARRGARPSPAGPSAVQASSARPPSNLAMVLDQTRWANTGALRDVGWVFFAIAMPVGLYALMAAQVADAFFGPAQMAFGLYFAVGMAVYGASITAFVNMPEAVAQARDRGLLKRLRGTPLAPWQFLAGRTSSVVWIAFATAILVFAVGLGFFGVEIAIGGLAPAVGVFLLGTLTLAACGYMMAALAPSGRAIGVMSVAIVLPLAFISDVFPFGGTMPEWLTTIGALFPMRHFVHALGAALNPGSVGIDPVNLLVLGAWLLGATAVAVVRFSWEPRR